MGVNIYIYIYIYASWAYRNVARPLHALRVMGLQIVRVTLILGLACNIMHLADTINY